MPEERFDREIMTEMGDSVSSAPTLAEESAVAGVSPWPMA